MHSKWKVCTCLLISLSVFCTYRKVLAIPRIKNEVLDTSYPILIQESISAGPQSETFFGFSVSLAQGSINQPNSPAGWIFIGAPKSNSSFRYNKDQSDVEPGVIWRCGLGTTSSKTDQVDCEIMKIDPDDNENRRPKNAPGIPRMESHSGSTIGISTLVNHERLVTCGMRWNRGRYQYYNGICYWFSDEPYNKQQASYRANDLSSLVNKRFYDNRLTPFFMKEDHDRTFSFTNRLNKSESGYEWQISQAGISVHLFLDESLGSKQPNLLIGAPGVRQWAGAVVLYTNTDKPKDKMGRANRNPNDPTFSEFVVLNRGIIPEKEKSYNEVHWDEYFGYSVSSGKYLNKDEVLYAAGAPRADYSGTVIIFRSPPYSPPNVTYKRQINPVVSIAAPSDSFASYFGSVIYSTDFDEDGLDELIIGAPLYTFGARDQPSALQENVKTAQQTSKNTETVTGNEGGDEGCVFIYKFNGGKEMGKHVNTAPIQTLCGSKSSQARFGSAIVSIKIDFKNEIGKVYLVVGAPFEVSNNGDSTSSGAIYLYLYNNKLGKFEGQFQRITASQINIQLKGFGSSLSIPADVDNNGTPDLAIGAFKSGHVVILRTRPKISLQSKMSVLSEKFNDIQKVLRGTKQFYLKSCVRVEESLGILEDRLEIWTRLRFFDPTIKFHEQHVNGRSNLGNTYNAIMYSSKNVRPNALEPTCETFTIEAVNKYGIGMNDTDHILENVHPFTFHQETWYNDSLTNGVFIYKMYAQQQRSLQENGNINFNSFKPKMPSAQISTLSLDVPVSLSDCKAVKCEPNLTMTWNFFHPLARNESMKSFLLGSTTEFLMELVIENTGETAENMTITLQWNNADIRESETGERWLHKSCTEDLSQTSKKIFQGCHLARYLLTGRNKTISIRVATDNVFAKTPTSFNFIATAKVIFGDIRINRPESSGQLQLQVPTTEAAIIGSLGNEVLRGITSYNVKKSSIEAKSDQTLGNSYPDSVRLYEPFRQTFSVRVVGVSVDEVVTHFKIPVAWNSLQNNYKQVFLVKQPHTMQLQNVKCELTDSSRFTFHSIEKINGSLPSFANSISSESFPHEHKYFVEEPIIVRRRREINPFANSAIQQQDERPQIAQDTHIPQMPKTKNEKPIPNEALKFMCASENDCLTVRCTIRKLKANTIFHIPFELFPVKDAIDDLLKTTKTSVLYIATNGSVEIFRMAMDKKHYHDADIASTILTKISSKSQLWIFFVAAGGGILLLLCITFGLYKCGFFKREKREELNQMKAEHRRKSIMMAAARASMLVQSSNGSESFESRENLTESEHRNEDTIEEHEQESEKPHQKQTNENKSKKEN